jgi:penicillin-binding protein A
MALTTRRRLLMARRGPSTRGRRILVRGLPVVLVAGLAFFLGIRVGSSGHRADRRAALGYLSAWAHADWRAAYRLLGASSRARPPYARFAAANAAAQATATVERVVARPSAQLHDGRVDVPVTVRTRVFGTLALVASVPVHDGAVVWAPELVFPGLRPGERLARQAVMPPRAAILARDGTPLARGPTRTSPVPAVAGQIVGQLGTPPPADRMRLRSLGYPPSALVGVSGLERALEGRLAGMPGGVLRAGVRVLARAHPRPAPAVRSSISVRVERAAIAALAGRLGGAAAVDPRTGEILALAGVAFSALQPPGSTFKIITSEAALQAHLVKLTDTFPVLTGATLEGRTIQNAGGESCGGTFVQAFANSCNSVFAPLGAKVGGARLVAAAERFGFNRPLGIRGAATSTIPPADRIGDDLAVGSSAIGQGKVQASALQMALVAATVATGGRRPRLTLLAGSSRPAARTVPAPVAHTIRGLMLAVVRSGTGTAAQIPGVAVAGKTGTAELRDTTQPTPPGGAVNTDAWFVAFAPALHPRVAAAVLLVQAGGGGAVAAPAARGVLVAGLDSTGRGARR